MNRTYFKGIALVAVLAFLLASTILVQAAPLNQDEGNAYEVIQGNADLSTLAEAIEAAGLEETLAGEGPFTVFAPNNAAFETIPADALEALLADTAMLSDLLLLHVVPGELLVADLAGQSPATALGDSLEIAGEGEELTVNGATIVEADIAASNGVVHVISAVLGVTAADEADEEGDEAAADEEAATDEEATDEAAEEGSDEEAATDEDAVEPAADAATEGDDAEGDDAASEEADEAAAEEDGDAAAPAMAPAADDGQDEDEENVAELSGRPRSQYMKVWKGVYQPRSLGR